MATPALNVEATLGFMIGMAPPKNSPEGFFAKADLAAKTVLETVEEDGVIQVFSHLDADGIAAAGIVGKALARLDARFRIRVTQWVDEKIIGEVLTEKPQLVILSDFGSGYINLLNEKIADSKVVILDHHQVAGEDKGNFVHVNPHLHGIDGASDISGSGVAYFAAKAINSKNKDLAAIAMVGALGDMQDKYDQRKLGGLNQKIVEDAVEANLIKVEKDLVFFGRETRPIHRVLAATTNPFIPGISGEEDKSLAFLASLKIKLKSGEKWRALRDLTEDEKRKLCSALAEYLLSKGLHYEVSNLIGHIYVLTNEESWTPLRDAREFAVMLNSTGRMDRPSLGIAVCMGERGLALEEAKSVLGEYRKAIGKYIRWVLEEPKRIQELENIFVVDGDTFIDEKIIGTISSILSLSISNHQKPLIAYAKVESEGIAKFSARTIETLVKKGVNLGEVMRVATEKHSGEGGGHNIAAGAQVPMEQIEKFIGTVNNLIGRQLKGDSIGSNNNT